MTDWTQKPPTPPAKRHTSKVGVWGAVMGLLFCLISLPTQSAAFSAKGNDNPTLAFNLGRTASFAPAMQFLDIAKHMHPWVGHKPGQWGSMSHEALQAGGYLDAEGWVRRIPEQVSHVGTIWQWSHHPEAAADRTGIYVLTYDGSGTLDLSGDVVVLKRAPGRIVFKNTAGKNIDLNILATDPNSTGNYIRNIIIVHENHRDLYAVGGRFNPDWLELIKDARVLRFMDWAGTNNSSKRQWRARSLPSGLFSEHGIPLEYMVQLANEVGADPWFTMPHQANARYVRQFATYVRDHVDPTLKVRVEYSNETWNWAFAQTRWLAERAQAEWDVGDHHAYSTKKATEVALIWNDVFGARATARLSHVLASQAMNPRATEKRLTAEVWRRNEPRTYVPPAQTFNELAIASYFGSATVAKDDLRRDLIADIKNPNVDAAKALTKNLMSRGYNSSIPVSLKAWKKQARLAQRNGMTLIGYEGGQHVHHSFAIKGLKKSDLAVLTDFMKSYVRSDEMADLYEELWAAWKQVGDGPFMQFTELSNVSKWGSWGLRNSLDDAVPRATRLERLSADQHPWWPTSPGSQYQHGVTLQGSAGPDHLIGTTQEDYLLGKGGDDIFEPGPGKDGIHGGPGVDEVRLSGTASMYDVRTTPDHIEVIGADRHYRLVDVEILAFEKGQDVLLKTLE